MGVWCGVNGADNSNGDGGDGKLIYKTKANAYDTIFPQIRCGKYCHPWRLNMENGVIFVCFGFVNQIAAIIFVRIISAINTTPHHPSITTPKKVKNFTFPLGGNLKLIKSNNRIASYQ